MDDAGVALDIGEELSNEIIYYIRKQNRPNLKISSIKTSKLTKCCNSCHKYLHNSTKICECGYIFKSIKTPKPKKPKIHEIYSEFIKINKEAFI